MLAIGIKIHDICVWIYDIKSVLRLRIGNALLKKQRYQKKSTNKNQEDHMY